MLLRSFDADRAMGSLRDPERWLWVGLAGSAYVTGWWIINVVRVFRGSERRRSRSARQVSDHTRGQNDGLAEYSSEPTHGEWSGNLRNFARSMSRIAAFSVNVSR